MIDFVKSANAVKLFAAGGFNWYGFLIGSGMIICIVIAYFMAKRGVFTATLFSIFPYAVFRAQ